MQRRTFLLSAGAAIGSTLSREGISRAKDGDSKPWLDPDYGKLPTPDEQTEGLADDAIAAQTRHRTAEELPVTGLPVGVGPHDKRIAALVKKGGFVGASFAVAIDRQLKVTRGFGHLCSHDRVPATPTSPGYLGSITKPLCAMTALTLVREGKLKLGQRVTDLLPLTPLLKAGEKRQPEIDRVTVAMLMNHTSGLFNIVENLFDRDYYNRLASDGGLELVRGDISQYDLVRRGMSVPFVSKPGTKYNYSGQGLQVLGRIIEKLTGKRLDVAMAERALAPLGVKRHATLSYLSPETADRIAAGKASKTRTFIPSPAPAKGPSASWAFDDPPENLYGRHWGQADACGASMLSAVDLLRFVSFAPALLGERLAIQALTPPRTAPYTNGLGWVVSMNKGRVEYKHNGAWSGIRAYCESTWDGVQFAVLAAGERDAEFDKIVGTVRDLGRSLRGVDLDIGNWKAYGFK